jgi:capsular polysaccharide biosynthesis protein
LHDEEYHFRNTKDASTKYLQARRFKKSMMQISFHISQPHWIEKGINLMHEYNSNYFHFIVETLPKMLIINDMGIPNNIPYIFESNLAPNISALIKLINQNKRSLIFLSPQKIYKINEILMPSDLSSIIDCYKNCSTKNESAIHVPYLKKAVSLIKNQIKEIDYKNLFIKDKIYVKRSGNYRLLLNKVDIEKSLVKLGFKIVDTTKMDISEQISTFENAELIVTPTGAHVTNIVLCMPQTKVIVLISDHKSHQPYLWELLGKVSLSKVDFIFGHSSEISKKDKYGVHADFTIPISSLLKMIKNTTTKKISTSHSNK